METNYNERIAQWGIGELARFNSGWDHENSAGRWRMELGVAWHEKLRKVAEAESAPWEFEQTIEGTLREGSWQFKLRGRVDQILKDSSGIHLREVKSVRSTIPQDPEIFRERYPGYFLQTAIYHFLLSQEYPDTKLESSLVFVDIQSGFTQSVCLEDSDYQSLKLHLGEVTSILNGKIKRLNEIGSISIPPPFEHWREGQEVVRKSLHNCLSSTNQVALLEAPTGFGKTGLAMEMALEGLKMHQVDRIFLLTSKNTGHAAAQKQMATMYDAGARVRYLTIRSRENHDDQSDPIVLATETDCASKWSESGILINKLFDSGTVSFEEINDLGNQLGIAPYALSRFLLSSAEVWIGDVNYVFDSQVSLTPLSVSGYNEERTLLIIDEAHNLPQRAELAMSFQLDYEAIHPLITEVHMSTFDQELIRKTDLLLSLLKRLSPSPALAPHSVADWQELLYDLSAIWECALIDFDSLSKETINWFFSLRHLANQWTSYNTNYLCYVEKKRCLNVTCIDASAFIRDRLLAFPKSLLMSATLKPVETFVAEIGMNGEDMDLIKGETPWQEQAYTVVVDTRPDTRMKARQSSLDLTAETIARTADVSPNCIAAFFPSYAYARSTLERIAFHFPYLRSATQPASAALEEQLAFLDEALMSCHILALVAGSRFTEGIDALGDRIQTAIVVSPGLPEPSPVIDAKAEGLSREERFHRFYLVPAMRKLNQTIGRLVRSPEQNASVLLHCQRFKNPTYINLLSNFLQPKELVESEESFQKNWLNCVSNR